MQYSSRSLRLVFVFGLFLVLDACDSAHAPAADARATLEMHQGTASKATPPVQTKPSTTTTASVTAPAIPPSVLAEKSSTPATKLTPALCEMLGLADEYISRFDHTGQPRPRFVESFYPKEASLAEAYEKLITAHEKDSGVKFEVTRERGDQGHITLLSETLAEVINSFYVKVNDRVATLDPKVILGAPRECQVRYLQGAYERWADREQNAIAMANATSKVETLGLVLKSLGCKTVAVFTTNTVPTGTLVFFEPTEEISKLLPIKTRLTQNEFLAALASGKLYKQL
jgi:hypothetical protein